MSSLLTMVANEMMRMLQEVRSFSQEGALHVSVCLLRMYVRTYVALSERREVLKKYTFSVYCVYVCVCLLCVRRAVLPLTIPHSFKPPP